LPFCSRVESVTRPPIRIAELAERLGGRPVEGDPDFPIRGVGSLEEGGPADLGFLRSASFAGALEQTRIGALIAPPDLEVGGRPVIRSSTPDLDFARAAALIVPTPRPQPGVHSSAFVDPSAKLDSEASIGAQVSVGARAEIGPRTVLHANVTVCDDVRVGADCVFHPGVVVRERCAIGDRVILQPGVAIGGDGFGYEFNEHGEHEKVPQLGNVVLEDDVEIGANSTVDRARLGTTRIERGVKIDNLVQVGHNCVIGAHSAIVAQSGLGGSTQVGSRVFIMAQAGSAGQLSIGDGCFVAGRAGVTKDLPPGSRVWGFPAVPEQRWHRSTVLVRRLPELLGRLRALERHLGLRPEGRRPRDE
jgi:UDP-3-O-[3-hydroxymyristoyl] glucosamine N-acyltransferase